jgi:hypothetical protein
MVICVAGAALSQVTIHIDKPTPSPSPEPGEPNQPPAIGRPAIILALVAACPSLFVSLAVAAVRVLQIRLTGITLSNNAVALLFSYLVSVKGTKCSPQHVNASLAQKQYRISLYDMSLIFEVVRKRPPPTPPTHPNHTLSFCF